MHIEFAPVDEKYIKDSVKNGYFKSEAEAVRYAVRTVREQNDNKRIRLMEALRLGEEDIAAGRVTPYTPELMDQLYQEALQGVRTGKKTVYDPDVTP